MAQFDPSDPFSFLYILLCFGKLRRSYVLRTPRTYVRTITYVTYVPKGYSGTYLCLSGTYVKVRTYVRHNAPFVRTLYDTCTHYVRTHKNCAYHSQRGQLRSTWTSEELQEFLHAAARHRLAERQHQGHLALCTQRPQDRW